MLSVGLSPVVSPGAQVLVLGSLPGAVSIQMQQYYAQPRNAFWKIMGALFGFDPALPYDARLAMVGNHHIALWDVCASAHRPGSLDSAIVSKSVVANDFNGFLTEHKALRGICFNGAKAAALYLRLVSPNLAPEVRTLPYETLPSTSPAHAAMPMDEKLKRWSIVKRWGER